MKGWVWAVCACSVLLVAAGCGGSKAKSPESSPRHAGAASSRSGVSLVETATARPGLAGVPAAALPGITVLGTAKESAKPDRANVSLTVGTGDFGANGPTFSLVEQHEVDPVLAALKKAGADQIVLNRFGQGLYGNQSAAQITFVSSPGEVEAAIDAAQAALRKQTDYDLQDASVVFGVSDCESLEQKAWTAALADAHARAERLAGLSDLQLGNVLAVSEATASSPLLGAAASGCQALEQPPTAGVLFASPVANTEEKATVAVTLQVTYAVTAK